MKESRGEGVLGSCGHDQISGRQYNQEEDLEDLWDPGRPLGSRLLATFALSWKNVFGIFISFVIL